MNRLYIIVETNKSSYNEQQITQNERSFIMLGY